MSGNHSADHPRLMSMAAAISDGMAINWAHTAGADPETTAVIDELRMIESLARLSDPMPGQWGAFVIHGEVGRGSYGTVYRALDPQLDIEVALKVIRPRPLEVAVDPSQALTEARLLAQINHPNVVRVYSAECLEQEVGVAMELVKGRTLHDLVRAQGPFSARETMLIGVDVCGALAAVHAAGVLHGDIKANNVMRARGWPHGADGLRRRRRPEADGVRGRSGAGTPLYLAPEVFAGAPAHGGLGHLQPGRAALLPGHRVVSGRRILTHRRSKGNTPRTHRAGCFATSAPICPTPSSAWSIAPRPNVRTIGSGRPVSWKRPCTRPSTASARPLLPLFDWRGLAAAASVVIVLGLASWSWTSRRSGPRPRRGPGGGAAPVTPAAADSRQLPGRSGVLSRAGRPQRPSGDRRARGAWRPPVAAGAGLHPVVRLHRQRG